MATTFGLGIVMTVVNASNQKLTGEGGPCGMIRRNQKEIERKAV